MAVLQPRRRARCWARLCIPCQPNPTHPATSSQAAADAAAAEALQQRLLSAYGSADQLLEGGAAACGLPGAGFPARLAGLVLEAAKKLGVPLGSALEVGSGVGATTFHLAAGGFESVVGVEHEARAVAAATAAQQAGTVAVGRKDEGHLRTPMDLPVPGGTAARNRVTFRQVRGQGRGKDEGGRPAALCWGATGVGQRLPCCAGGSPLCCIGL